ncbi:MAG: hypothetical protein GC206_05735 [Alphaproteobacteria bacterium]|nr:hypothetical protein [Alphaproteobacteria bacterium]
MGFFERLFGWIFRRTPQPQPPPPAATRTERPPPGPAHPTPPPSPAPPPPAASPAPPEVSAPAPNPSPPDPSPPPLPDPPPEEKPAERPKPKEIHLERQPIGSRVRHFATIDGTRFQIGDEQSFDSPLLKKRCRGIYILKPREGFTTFEPDQWRARYGVWADMIAVTSDVEGGRDIAALNSYDGAGFTFGLMQWAAHVPDANLVLLLRKMLALPNAPAYFPDLTLNAEGRICQLAGDGKLIQLERSGRGLEPTAPLRRYLNEDDVEVDERELLTAAKLLHWVRFDPEGQRTLIEFAFEDYKHNVALRAKTFPLDGRLDVEVMLIADIYHHGRGATAARGREAGRQRAIKAALASSDPTEGLVSIGEGDAKYIDNRILGLRREIDEALQAGVLGHHVYDAATHDFRLKT